MPNIFKQLKYLLSVLFGWLWTPELILECSKNAKILAVPWRVFLLSSASHSRLLHRLENDLTRKRLHIRFIALYLLPLQDVKALTSFIYSQNFTVSIFRTPDVSDFCASTSQNLGHMPPGHRGHRGTVHSIV